MSKISNIFSTLFLTSILTCNLAFGIGSEFKNSLMKMEFNKVNEGTYNVDLYTKNKFTDPVKIIKKSDSNYYILLPETRNETARAIQTNADIKSAGVMSAPYAGQDVNNGYIKIDINTTKPINFNVNVKSVSAAAPIVAKKQTEQAEKPQIANNTVEKKTTKRSSGSYSSKKVSQVARRNYKKNTRRIATQRKQELPKIEPKAEILEMSAEEIDNISELPLLPPELANQNVRKQEDTSKLKPIKENKKTEKQLSGFGINFVNFLLFCLAILGIGFVIFAAIRTQKTAQIKLKSKASLLGIEFEKAKNKIKETAKSARNGKFFVFDKGVKQNALIEPATQVPDVQPIPHETKGDSEIIHKALNENVAPTPAIAFEEVIAVAQEVEEHKEAQVVSCPITTEEMQIQEAPKVATEITPKVLSSVEVAPKRGFMCVSYKNKVSLMGYIFDDVFVLYNFKKTRMTRNYDIQYRLSDKIGKESFYIIKVSDVKMLVKVSKTNISREVLL